MDLRGLLLTLLLPLVVCRHMLSGESLLCHQFICKGLEVVCICCESQLRHLEPAGPGSVPTRALLAEVRQLIHTALGTEGRLLSERISSSPSHKVCPPCPGSSLERLHQNGDVHSRPLRGVQ